MDLTLKYGAGGRRAPTIQDPLIVTESMALRRAQVALDRHWWSRTRRSVTTAFRGIRVGDVVTISDALNPTGAQYIVTQVVTTVDELGRATQNLELEGNYREPDI